MVRDFMICKCHSNIELLQSHVGQKATAKFANETFYSLIINVKLIIFLSLSFCYFNPHLYSRGTI